MPRKQRSPETIIHKLREAEILISQGKTVKEAAKQIGVTEQKSHKPDQAATAGRTRPAAVGCL